MKEGPPREEFFTPGEKEQEVDDRLKIEQLAAYLSSEDKSDKENNKLLATEPFKTKVPEYLERMNQLEARERENPGTLGPADDEDLRTFRAFLRLHEERMEEQTKEQEQ